MSVITCPELSSYQRRFRSSVTDPKLDNEVPGKVLRLDLAPFLPPQPHQGDLVIAHDDPSV